jgi:hypothetical protein
VTDRKSPDPPPRNPTALLLASSIAALIVLGGVGWAASALGLPPTGSVIAAVVALAGVVVLERWLARKQGRARWL